MPCGGAGLGPAEGGYAGLSQGQCLPPSLGTTNLGTHTRLGHSRKVGEFLGEQHSLGKHKTNAFDLTLIKK